MHLSAFERLEAWEIWPLRLIELTNSADKEVACDFILRIELGILATSCRGHSRSPFELVFIPDSLLNGRVEPDVLVDIVLLCNVDQISQYLFLSRILSGPVCILCKGEAI